MIHPGARIKQRRTVLQLTQVELARLIGITQSSLSELERGDSMMPSAEVLLKLSKILGVSAAWIVTGKDGELEVLDSQEERFHHKLRKLTAAQRQAVYTLVDSMASEEPD